VRFRAAAVAGPAVSPSLPRSAPLTFNLEDKLQQMICATHSIPGPSSP
jgi:hypothetical protein